MRKFSNIVFFNLGTNDILGQIIPPSQNYVEFLCVCVCACVHAHTCVAHSTHTEVREQFVETSLLLEHLSRFWGLNLSNRLDSKYFYLLRHLTSSPNNSLMGWLSWYTVVLSSVPGSDPLDASSTTTPPSALRMFKIKRQDHPQLTTTTTFSVP